MTTPIFYTWNERAISPAPCAHVVRALIFACHTHQLRKLVRPKPDQPDRLLRPCQLGVPTVPSPCFLRQSSTVAKHFVSFVLIRFVIGELLSEVGGRVGHGLVLAWFESYVLCLVFLDNRQDKRNTLVSYLSLSAS